MLKVAAYCRVSTDKDDQLNSLENQKNYFDRYINSNPDWEFIDTYVDEGRSGTSTKKRKAFNRMIADAERGKFDLLLTKEISRFARNTLDSIHYTRKLKELGIGVLFLNDNINTLEPDSELRLTFMSSMAQDESRRTSERVKWGQQRSMEQGVVFGNTILGYTLKEGKLCVNPIEAETVKLIFKKYLDESKGLNTIAIELERAGITTSYNKSKWDATAVSRILKNEKYCGDLKQKKYITPNYLTHATKKNKGTEQFIVLKDHHAPIISRDVFDRTQAELARRGAMKENGVKYTNRYAFSGKLKCGLCGASFVSRNRKANDGIRNIRRWQCSRYFKHGAKREDNEDGCENTMVRNEILEHVLQFALGDAIKNKDTIIDECVKLVSSVLNADQIQNDHAEVTKELDRLSNRSKRLLGFLLDGTISQDDFKSEKAPIDLQIVALQEKLTQLDNNVALIGERGTLISAIKDRVTNIVYAEAFSDEVATEILDKIVIYGKDRYEVYFNGVDEDFFLATGVCNSCHLSLRVLSHASRITQSNEII